MRLDEIKLAVAMAKKKMSLTKLAELSGVSRATLSYAKAGKRINADTIAKIALALEVPVVEILED